MKAIILSFLTLAILSASSCSSNSTGKLSLVNPKEFSEKLTATPEAQLIDVRTPEEFQAGSIAGFGIGAITGIVRKSPILGSAIAGSGYGLAIGSLLVPTMIFMKMQSKEEIEFQDRSWRLQRNAGQCV